MRDRGQYNIELISKTFLENKMLYILNESNLEICLDDSDLETKADLNIF